LAISKKDKILQTALKLVAAGGFHASPMSELAKKSGVAVGTIYHYYATKDDMIRDLYIQCKANMSDAMIKSLSKDGKLRERFENLWKALYTHYVNNPLEFSFLQQYHNSPFVGKETEEESEKYYTTVIEFFKAGIKKGSIRKSDITVLTEFLYAAVSAAVNTHLSKNKKDLTRKDISDFIEMSWSAIKP
jgi:TetR/AcrR family transcriptional regulator, multidrug resistance operon repressor